MDVTTKGPEPPAFPARWTASYVSYWQPSSHDDAITSGTVWFDYDRRAFRIDGLFNPWSEVEHGYRLWLSEVNRYGEGAVFFRELRYRAEEGFHRSERVDTEAPSQGCLLPRTVLRDRDARAVEAVTLLGFPCIGWHFVDERGRPARYYLSDDARLVRMVTGEPTERASVRDFPTWSCAPVPDDVFSPHVPVTGPAATSAIAGEER